MSTQHNETSRTDTLMLFLDGDPAKALDPVRVMKGLFLIAQEVPAGWVSPEGRYEFEPYHYGPFSADIYRDIGYLRNEGLVACREVPGQTWCRYSLTAEGRTRAQEAADGADPRLVSYISRLRDWVTSLTFNELLTAVYDRYPAFAKNSVFVR